MPSRRPILSAAVLVAVVVLVPALAKGLSVRGWLFGEDEVAARSGGAVQASLSVDEIALDNDRQAVLSAPTLLATIPDSVLEEPYWIGRERRVLEVTSGDTLMAMLTREAVPRNLAHAAIAAMADAFDPRRLRIGQEITLVLDHHGPAAEFAALELEPSVESRVIVERDPEGGFTASEIETTLVTRPFAAAGEIEHSLFLDANRAGVPDAVLINLIRAMSYQVDFQRDLQPGDRFEIFYDQDYRTDGAFARHGAVRYASLVLSGRELALYRYEDRDGFVDYYNRDGESMRRLLMRTPIDGARISSNFGMRNHPILGYSRLHRGVDFAAPTGTPIYAAGNGTIEQIGWNGGYGNYVRIRHNGSIQTAYAHLNGFARGLSRGDRVRQGQVIGYVGTTGQSTGPHLHYEVHVQGQAVNPMSVDLPTGNTLAGDELRRFRQQAAEIDQAYAALLDEAPDRRFADRAEAP